MLNKISMTCCFPVHFVAGVLVAINNYTGDRLNFGIAIERARTEGIHIDMVVNAEDCALSSADKSAGRRGLAASIFIMKVFILCCWHISVESSIDCMIAYAVSSYMLLCGSAQY